MLFNQHLKNFSWGWFLLYQHVTTFLALIFFAQSCGVSRQWLSLELLRRGRHQRGRQPGHDGLVHAAVPWRHSLDFQDRVQTQTLNQRGISEALNAQGAAVLGGTPDALSAMVKSETGSFTRMAREFNIRLD